MTEDKDNQEQPTPPKKDVNTDKSGFTGGTQEKTRTGTDDARKRSDSGTGL